MCLNRISSNALCMQGVPADFLTRNEQYVNTSTQQKPSQVGTSGFLGTMGCPKLLHSEAWQCSSSGA